MGELAPLGRRGTAFQNVKRANAKALSGGTKFKAGGGGQSQRGELPALPGVHSQVSTEIPSSKGVRCASPDILQPLPRGEG